MSPEEQAADPAIFRLLRAMQNPGSTEARSGLWEVRTNGLVYRRAYDSVGEPRPRLCLPSSHQYELMHHSHYTLNPGHRSGALFTTLRRDYYWENMQVDCENFVHDCRQCGSRKPMPSSGVDPGNAPTPRLPFEVVHLDFKGPLHGTKVATNTTALRICTLYTRMYINVDMQDRKNRVISQNIL